MAVTGCVQFSAGRPLWVNEDNWVHDFASSAWMLTLPASPAKQRLATASVSASASSANATASGRRRRRSLLADASPISNVVTDTSYLVPVAYVMPCAVSGTCSGNATGESAYGCYPGNYGPMCIGCFPAYFKQPGGLCAPCTNTGALTSTVLVDVGFFAFGAVAFGMVFLLLLRPALLLADAVTAGVMLPGGTHVPRSEWLFTIDEDSVPLPPEEGEELSAKEVAEERRRQATRLKILRGKWFDAISMAELVQAFHPSWAVKIAYRVVAVLGDKIKIMFSFFQARGEELAS